MLNSSDSFKLNTPGVVCDIVDNEVVIVSLESGAYYSTENAGAAVWQYLSAGQSVESIVHSMTARYAGPHAEIEKGVHDLIGTLLSEDLIVLGADDETTPSNELGQGEKAPLTGIELQKFYDMEDLLLLDPVHEVAEEGWPHKSN